MIRIELTNEEAMRLAGWVHALMEDFGPAERSTADWRFLSRLRSKIAAARGKRPSPLRLMTLAKTSPKGTEP